MLEAIDNDPSMKSVVTWITDIEYQNPPFCDIGEQNAGGKDDKNKKKDGSTSTSNTSVEPMPQVA